MSRAAVTSCPARSRRRRPRESCRSIPARAVSKRPPVLPSPPPPHRRVCPRSKPKAAALSRTPIRRSSARTGAPLWATSVFLRSRNSFGMLWPPRTSGEPLSRTTRRCEGHTAHLGSPPNRTLPECSHSTCIILVTAHCIIFFTSMSEISLEEAGRSLCRPRRLAAWRTDLRGARAVVEGRQRSTIPERPRWRRPPPFLALSGGRRLSAVFLRCPFRLLLAPESSRWQHQRCNNGMRQAWHDGRLVWLRVHLAGLFSPYIDLGHGRLPQLYMPRARQGEEGRPPHARRYTL